MSVLCYDSIKTESYCYEIYNMYNTFCQFICECLFNHLCRILTRTNGVKAWQWVFVLPSYYHSVSKME